MFLYGKKNLPSELVPDVIKAVMQRMGGGGLTFEMSSSICVPILAGYSVHTSLWCRIWANLWMFLMLDVKSLLVVANVCFGWVVAGRGLRYLDPVKLGLHEGPLLECRSIGSRTEIWFVNFCVKPYVPREPRRDSSNRRLNEHGIYIYIYTTLPGIELTTCSVPSGSRYH